MLIPEPQQLTLVLLIELLDDAITFIVMGIASRGVEEQVLRRDCCIEINTAGLQRRCSGSILGADASVGVVAKSKHGIAADAAGTPSMVMCSAPGVEMNEGDKRPLEAPEAGKKAMPGR